MMFFAVSTAISLSFDFTFSLEEVTNAFKRGRTITASIAIATMISTREKPLLELFLI